MKAVLPLAIYNIFADILAKRHVDRINDDAYKAMFEKQRNG